MACKYIHATTVAAKGPKQDPSEAAAPPMPEVVHSDETSTASLVDVDVPSVHTVPSDFNDQEVKTSTQAERRDREEYMREYKQLHDEQVKAEANKEADSKKATESKKATGPKKEAEAASSSSSSKKKHQNDHHNDKNKSRDKDNALDLDALRRKEEEIANEAKASAQSFVDRLVNAHSGAAFPEATTAINVLAVVGISSFLGYKAWRLYDIGRLTPQHVGIGAGVMTLVAVAETLLGRFVFGPKSKRD